MRSIWSGIRDRCDFGIIADILAEKPWKNGFFFMAYFLLLYFQRHAYIIELINRNGLSRSCGDRGKGELPCLGLKERQERLTLS